jgi:hypothetical protein
LVVARWSRQGPDLPKKTELTEIIYRLGSFCFYYFGMVLHVVREHHYDFAVVSDIHIGERHRKDRLEAL